MLAPMKSSLPDTPSRADQSIVKSRHIKGYFKRVGGTEVYLRIAPEAIRYFKLSEKYVYGVNEQGQITRVQRNTYVERCLGFPKSGGHAWIMT
jgi:hypothetical protein